MADSSAYHHRILSPREAYARVGLSRVTAWKLRKVGQFPEPVPITIGRIGYLESEIDQWIEGRIAARDAGQGAAHD